MQFKDFAPVMLACLAACSQEPDMQYTLYRTSVDMRTREQDETRREHVATFDANISGLTTSDIAKYNQANCEFSQELFNANQPHYRDTKIGAVKLRYWCEKGRYRG